MSEDLQPGEYELPPEEIEAMWRVPLRACHKPHARRRRGSLRRPARLA
jgi:hypothetical protein